MKIDIEGDKIDKGPRGGIRGGTPGALLGKFRHTYHWAIDFD